MFIPKRIFVHSNSRFSPKTKIILDNVRKYNPSVQIQKLPGGQFHYPADITSAKEKYDWMNESLIIRPRVERFIRTFPSPGDIVEDYTTVINLSWMCGYHCEYCYLQLTQPPEHSLYSNVDEMKRELQVAPYTHWAGLTIWSMLSFALQEPLLKIPSGLREITDDLREQMTDSFITNDRRAIDLLHLKQKSIFQRLFDNRTKQDKKFTFNDFNRSHKEIVNIYLNNKSHTLPIVASEFNDLLAIDHLGEYTNDIIPLVQKIPSINIKIRSKSAFVDNMVKHDGLDRVNMISSLNTPYIIDHYEHGTSSLDERLYAARLIQESKGYILTVVIEPIIKYDGFEDDYVKLIRKTFKALDPTRIAKITIGCVRYRKQLMSMILKHYPDTDLFARSQQLQEPKGNDARMRYSESSREGIYNRLIKEVRKHSQIPVSLGAEHKDIWDALRMSPEVHMRDAVFQFQPLQVPPESRINKMPKRKETFKKKDVKTSRHKDIIKSTEKPTTVKVEVLSALEEITNEEINEFSKEFDCAYSAMERSNQGVDYTRFQECETRLNELIHIHTDPESGEQLVEDLWKYVSTINTAEAFHSARIWKPIKFVGKIETISPPKPIISSAGEDEHYSARTIKIRGNDGTILDSLAIPIEQFTGNSDLNKLYTKQAVVVFCGAMIPVQAGKQDYYRLFLKDIKINPSPLDLSPTKFSKQIAPGFSITLKDGKRIGIPEDHPYLFVSENRGGNKITDYIKEQLADYLKIKGLDSAKELEKALEFIILQSFSFGKDSHSHRLHGLVIGPPGVGKSFLTQSALILNQRGEQIASIGAKITAAGLIGESGKKSTVNGILPRNTGGIVCIQDFHEVRGGSRTQVCGIFSQMMEDGEVTATTKNAVTLQAEVSLHLDMNRYSQVDPSGTYNSFSDINIPINVLSRFDFIMEIKRDVLRQESLVKEMVATNRGIKSQSNNEDKNVFELKLRNLVTWLKDTYDSVEPTSQTIQEYIDKMTNETLDKYRPSVNSGNLWEDFQTRTGRTIIKLIKAVTCANADYEIKKEYVDYAFRFVEPKLDFLCSIDPKDILGDTSGETDEEYRQRALRDEFIGKEISTREIAGQLNTKYPEIDVSQKTIQRDLEKIGAKYNKKTRKWKI